MFGGLVGWLVGWLVCVFCVFLVSQMLQNSHFACNVRVFSSFCLPTPLSSKSLCFFIFFSLPFPSFTFSLSLLLFQSIFKQFFFFVFLNLSFFFCCCLRLLCLNSFVKSCLFQAHLAFVWYLSSFLVDFASSCCCCFEKIMSCNKVFLNPAFSLFLEVCCWCCFVCCCCCWFVLWLLICCFWFVLWLLICCCWFVFLLLLLFVICCCWVFVVIAVAVLIKNHKEEKKTKKNTEKKKKTTTKRRNRHKMNKVQENKEGKLKEKTMLCKNKAPNFDDKVTDCTPPGFSINFGKHLHN